MNKNKTGSNELSFLNESILRCRNHIYSPSPFCHGQVQYSIKKFDNSTKLSGTISERSFKLENQAQLLHQQNIRIKAINIELQYKLKFAQQRNLAIQNEIRDKVNSLNQAKNQLIKYDKLYKQELNDIKYKYDMMKKLSSSKPKQIRCIHFLNETYILIMNSQENLQSLPVVKFFIHSLLKQVHQVIEQKTREQKILKQIPVKCFNQLNSQLNFFNHLIYTNQNIISHSIEPSQEKQPFHESWLKYSINRMYKRNKSKKSMSRKYILKKDKKLEIVEKMKKKSKKMISPALIQLYDDTYLTPEQCKQKIIEQLRIFKLKEYQDKKQQNQQVKEQQKIKKVIRTKHSNLTFDYNGDIIQIKNLNKIEPLYNQISYKYFQQERKNVIKKTKKFSKFIQLPKQSYQNIQIYQSNNIINEIKAQNGVSINYRGLIKYSPYPYLYSINQIHKSNRFFNQNLQIRMNDYLKLIKQGNKIDKNMSNKLQKTQAKKLTEFWDISKSIKNIEKNRKKETIFIEHTVKQLFNDQIDLNRKNILQKTQPLRTQFQFSKNDIFNTNYIKDSKEWNREINSTRLSNNQISYRSLKKNSQRSKIDYGKLY